MVIISKHEAEYLNKDMGVKFGDKGIHVTRSKHSGKSYRLTESKRNLELLKNYRQKNN